MTRRSNVTAQHFDIATYWRKHPDRDQWAPTLIDLDTPACFACGWTYYHWYKDTYAASWKAARALEKCHIVPAALGGTDDVSNLLLLCAECHIESPDLADPQHMSDWIVRKHETGYRGEASMWLIQQVVAELGEEFIEAAYGTPEQAAKTSKAFREKLHQGVGRHFGVGLSKGTLVATMRDAVASADADTN